MGWKTAPLFSILMPTHNRSTVLAAAIRSVLRQNQPSFELLVVGDGCTDDSAEVVASFRDRRVRWFDFPKGDGFGYANRNKALREARGDLIAFAAHDDLYFPDHLHRMGTLFHNPSIYWAYSRPCWIRDDGLCIPYFGNLNSSAEFARFRRRNFIPASCVVYRRSLHDAVGLWPEDVKAGGDWVFWRRMLEHKHLVPGQIGFEQHVTQLHFRANWRDPNSWGPPPFKALSDLADSSEAYPKQLRLGLQENGVSPQQQVMSRIEADGDALSHRIRQGSDLLQDTLAWEYCLTAPTLGPS